MHNPNWRPAGIVLLFVLWPPISIYACSRYFPRSSSVLIINIQGPGIQYRNSILSIEFPYLRRILPDRFIAFFFFLLYNVHRGRHQHRPFATKGRIRWKNRNSGGISAASTVQYYNKILDLYYEIKKDYYYPEICIESLNFQYFTDFENRNDMDGYKEYIMKGIRNLESAGSDIIIMSANSPHSVFHAIEKKRRYQC